jgi:excisionase family DNA binding protein
VRQHGALKNWIDRRELSAARLGSRRVRVKRSDLDRFIEESSSIVPHAARPPADPRVGGDLREQFASALEASSFAVGEGDDEKLVAALSALSEAAKQLADAL